MAEQANPRTVEVQDPSAEQTLQNLHEPLMLPCCRAADALIESLEKSPHIKWDKNVFIELRDSRPEIAMDIFRQVYQSAPTDQDQLVANQYWSTQRHRIQGD